jgi:phosphoglycerate dehydrogenase-like enzyme
MLAASQLRAIISPILGIEGLDVGAATELGILVANGQAPENFESVAEATFMLMLVCLYDLHGTEQRLRRNEPRQKPADVRARMLRGKRVGIIGHGNVGRALISRLHGWDAHVLVHSRHASALPAHAASVSLDELLRDSDIVVVAASLNPTTRHLLDADRLDLMKPGAILINTARGPIIDEMALYERAVAGRFGKVALDVFEVEPLPADSPLRRLHDVILTPHSVAHTQESSAAIPRLAIENVRRVLRGEPPAIVQNPTILGDWVARWSRQAEAR